MAQNPRESPTYAWTVIKVEDAFGPASLGGQNRMKRVTFRMANGDESYVDVPYVPTWVTDAAREIDKMVEGHIDALNLHSMESVE